MSVVTVQLKGTKQEVITGIAHTENSSAVLEAFPNPLQLGTVLKLVVNKTGIADISLTDVNGKSLHTIHKGYIETLPFYKEADLSTLPRGVYLLKLKLDEKMVTKKIIIF